MPFYLPHSVPAVAEGVPVQGDPGEPGRDGSAGKVRVYVNGQYSDPDRLFTDFRGHVRVEDDPNADLKKLFFDTHYSDVYNVVELKGKREARTLVPPTMYLFRFGGVDDPQLYMVWAVDVDIFTNLCISFNQLTKVVQAGYFNFDSDPFEFTGLDGGAPVDLSNYYTKGEVDSILMGYLTGSDLAPYARTEDVNNGFQNLQNQIDEIWNAISAIRQLPDPTGQDGKTLTVVGATPIWSTPAAPTPPKYCRCRIRMFTSVGTAAVTYEYKNFAEEIEVRATTGSYDTGVSVINGDQIEFFVAIPGLSFDPTGASSANTYFDKVKANMRAVGYLSDESRTPVGFRFDFLRQYNCLYISGTVGAGQAFFDFFLEFEDAN